MANLKLMIPGLNRRIHKMVCLMVELTDVERAKHVVKINLMET